MHKYELSDFPIRPMKHNTTGNGCCEKCHGEFTPKYGINSYRCLNGACECHQPNQNSRVEEVVQEIDTFLTARFQDAGKVLVSFIKGEITEEQRDTILGKLNAVSIEEIRQALLSFQGSLLADVDGIVEKTRANEDDKGLSVFANPTDPFGYQAGTPNGDRDRKLFAMGYLQSKKDIRAKLASKRTKKV